MDIYRELTIPTLAAFTGVSEAVWRERIQCNPIWRKAFFPSRLDSNKLATAMYRITRAHDELSEFSLSGMTIEEWVSRGMVAS